MTPSSKPITKDWSQFAPQDYLQEYYGDVGSENFSLLSFLVKAFENTEPNSLLLDFGCGPTIYSLIAAAPKVKEIHLCDYVDANLQEIQTWLQNDSKAWDWKEFIATTLKLERVSDINTSEIIRREMDIRHRVTKIMHCDANLAQPIGEITQLYDIIVSNFFAESATDSSKQWHVFLQNITSLLKPHGKFITCVLKEATSYSIGAKVFPAVFVTEESLRLALEEIGYEPYSILIESIPADRPSRHYKGLITVIATKNH